MTVPFKHPGSSRTSTIISSAGIVQRRRHAHEAPLLVEAHVSHGIEELLPLVVERVGAKPKCGRGGIYRGSATARIALGVVFKRDIPRQAAAELPGISGADAAVGRSVVVPLPSR